MWKNYVNAISTDYTFTAPATPTEIQSVHKELNVKLPLELLELYNETNGVFDAYGCHLIWPIARMIEDNLFFRNFEDYKDIYMPFDHLLFFSDSGCGDIFGFRILNGCIETEDVYVWNHEDDSRTWVASSLKTFIKGLMTGEITT